MTTPTTNSQSASSPTSERGASSAPTSSGFLGAVNREKVQATVEKPPQQEQRGPRKALRGPRAPGFVFLPFRLWSAVRCSQATASAALWADLLEWCTPVVAGKGRSDRKSIA